MVSGYGFYSRIVTNLKQTNERSKFGILHNSCIKIGQLANHEVICLFYKYWDITNVYNFESRSNNCNAQKTNKSQTLYLVFILCQLGCTRCL